jgi:hypothetical protein
VPFLEHIAFFAFFDARQFSGRNGLEGNLHKPCDISKRGPVSAGHHFPSKLRHRIICRYPLRFFFLFSALRRGQGSVVFHPLLLADFILSRSCEMTLKRLRCGRGAARGSRWSVWCSSWLDGGKMAWALFPTTRNLGSGTSNSVRHMRRLRGSYREACSGGNGEFETSQVRAKIRHPRRTTTSQEKERFSGPRSHTISWRKRTVWLKLVSASTSTCRTSSRPTCLLPSGVVDAARYWTANASQQECRI